MTPRSLCLFALLGGCVLPPATATESTTQPAPVAAVGTLTCADVFSCFAGCADEACYAACRDAGSADAQPRVSAMLDCTTSVCANDSDCVASACQAEIQACVGGGSSSTTTTTAVASNDLPGQPHSNEGLLEWMTGDWIGTNYQFEFHADGTVRRSSGIALYNDRGDYGCVSLVNDIGTVVQEGDIFVMTFETSDTNHCGDKYSSEPVVVRYQIQWFDNPYDDTEYLQLQLRELDCTRGGDMYCVDGMNRRK